ncbi:Shedu anti-phage system protein SduA domain-containing protein [Frankia sp. AgKG'84/4]|uniref:Shedu anti-phage system protein SduA domain-containing protein n=1 Tax=Frankia sp. AgKG'84/4 TaxID=573490 RepID=UPI00200F0FF9|nr:Shedu anti-phage system protein SduA domain-containing protein [Frankia sp. AgKG'84/4]MCL9796170.1 DUF4263 domain-containing protein [Frankia sp. AgKG'84/4]
MNDSATSEADVQRAMEDAYWVFGGEFIGRAARRRLTALHEIDSPLLRPDGVLHLVELKRPSAPVLRFGSPQSAVVSAEVNEAVGQVMQCLNALDEQRDAIRSEFSVDTRRASATVIIGNALFQPRHQEQTHREALRVYNSYLSRIDVRTYDDVIDSAERSLTLDA